MKSKLIKSDVLEEQRKDRLLRVATADIYIVNKPCCIFRHNKKHQINSCSVKKGISRGVQPALLYCFPKSTSSLFKPHGIN